MASPNTGDDLEWSEYGRDISPSQLWGTVFLAGITTVTAGVLWLGFAWACK